MGKDKDKPGAGRRLAPFLTNLARIEPYKPRQGVRSRTWTGAALGGVVVLGLWRFHEVLQDNYTQTTRFLIVALTAAIFGWLIYRTLNFPPFVDFLTDTEVEMKKVSWTSKDDLYRATMVVLTTVVLMSVFLFLVDQIWVRLLEMIHVLQVNLPTPEG